MLIGEFDDLMENQPFVPFEIVTADGQSLLVKSREFAWHVPASRIVYVASGKLDGRTHRVDLQLVTQFILHEGNGSTKRGKSRKSSQ